MYKKNIIKMATNPRFGGTSANPVGGKERRKNMSGKGIKKKTNLVGVRGFTATPVWGKGKEDLEVGPGLGNMWKPKVTTKRKIGGGGGGVTTPPPQ